jgi:hypothetical protein
VRWGSVVLCLALLAASAVADPGGAPSVKPARRSYRPLVIVTDLGVGVLAFGAAAHHRESLLAVACVGWVGAVPLVHAIGGNYERAGASLGLRVGLPFAGGLVAYALHKVDTCTNSVDGCGDAEFALVPVGVLVATVVDWVLPSEVDLPVTTRLAATRGGAALTFSGTF